MGGEKWMTPKGEISYIGSPPRGRGKVDDEVQKMHDMGSPPRGRGKENPHRVTNPVGGITPAWAGKSPTVRKVSDKWEDHPRVGGEKTKKIP